MRRAAVLALALFSFAPLSAASWISVKTGPFVVFSEDTRKAAREQAAELEQFRFSLGELLGIHDLTVHPQLQLFVFAQAPTDSPPVRTRTGAFALTQRPGPLLPETRKALARILLEGSVGRLPEGLERGLETFLSTTQVHGAQVTWGTPPPAAQRDADWALVDWLITNPDTYGNVRVLLANVERGVDEAVAFRNSIHMSRAEAERAANAYLASGNFRTIDGPSRPLSAERDLAAHDMDANSVTLRFADLLDAQSEQRYRDLLAAGAYKTEAEEGLALLAARHGDTGAAADLLQKAIADGSKNAVAMIEYARLEPDSAKARKMLESAVAADPASAEAHALLAAKSTNPAQQIGEYREATKLAPRVQDNWVKLAEALADQKQWSEAAKAWSGAEHAASSPAEHERMISARLAIEGQRLDFEDAEKRRQKEAEQREINRLKQEAIAEIRAAEAKVNKGSSPSDAANAIPWEQFENGGTERVDGALARVQCVGRRTRIVVRAADGKLIKLNADPARLELSKEARPALACGPQKGQSVSVTYNPKRNAGPGVAGDATAIEFH